MNIAKTESLNEITVSCTEGISRKKNKLITVKITAPKEAFMLSEALSRFGKVPSIEAFFTSSGRMLLADYLAKAEQVLSSASPQPPSLKSN